MSIIMFIILMPPPFYPSPTRPVHVSSTCFYYYRHCLAVFILNYLYHPFLCYPPSLPLLVLSDSSTHPCTTLHYLIYHILLDTTTHHLVPSHLPPLSHPPTILSYVIKYPPPPFSLSAPHALRHGVDPRDLHPHIPARENPSGV